MTRIGLVLSICSTAMVTSAQATDLTPLVPVSTEYTRVQVADWIDGSSFAMGRWDGSLGIFRVDAKPGSAVTLVQSFVTSGGGGVEMVGTLDQDTLVFSDNGSQLGILARKANDVFEDRKPAPYDAGYGIANSVTSLRDAGVDLVVTGHAIGFAIVWKKSSDGLALLKAIDLKSPNPIPSPYPLRNIRGLATWRNGIVISGSEDGDLVAFDVHTGKILFRQRYSTTAERGINGIALVGDRLFVVNCAVGLKDRNLWLYGIGEDGFSLLDSINLVRDSTREQVFDFDVDAFNASGKTRFVSSTEEGLIWSGSVIGDKIQVDGVGEASNNGAASLDINPADGSILAGSQDLLIFPPLQ